MPETVPRPRSAFLAHEDWWAIWLGGLLILAAVSGLLTAVPGVGQWAASLGDALGAERLAGLVGLGID